MEHFSREQLDSDRRQAHKVNRLVDEGLLSAEQVSQMSEEEFNMTVCKMFDARFQQDYWHPQKMGKREFGHHVEDRVIVELERLGLFHVEHSSDEQDQGTIKADIVITLDGFRQPIFVQLTLLTGEAARKKFAKLPEATIPVVAEAFPSDDEIRRYPERLTRAMKSILAQIFAGLRQTPEYRPAFDALWQRYARAA